MKLVLSRREIHEHDVWKAVKTQFLVHEIQLPIDVIFNRVKHLHEYNADIWGDDIWYYVRSHLAVWIEENTTGYFMDDTLYVNGIMQLIYRFSDKNDAMRFKLVWG